MLTEAMMCETMDLPIPFPAAKLVVHAGGQRRRRFKFVLSVRKPRGGIC